MLFQNPIPTYIPCAAFMRTITVFTDYLHGRLERGVMFKLAVNAATVLLSVHIR